MLTLPFDGVLGDSVGSESPGELRARGPRRTPIEVVANDTALHAHMSKMTEAMRCLFTIDAI